LHGSGVKFSIFWYDVWLCQVPQLTICTPR